MDLNVNDIETATANLAIAPNDVSKLYSVSDLSSPYFTPQRQNLAHATWSERVCYWRRGLLLYFNFSAALCSLIALLT
jgi:hypothetical protein